MICFREPNCFIIRPARWAEAEVYLEENLRGRSQAIFASGRACGASAMWIKL
jgi:hypothetical protein